MFVSCAEQGSFVSAAPVKRDLPGACQVLNGNKDRFCMAALLQLQQPSGFTGAAQCARG